MAKVPKHRRIKRATVLIKRTRCIRNVKTKTCTPLHYHKLKVNNHSLARALSQEKKESQLLFSRNVELLAEVQDLAHACNNRDLVITNILKNAKDMMQMLVTMSGCLTNTISSCQEFVSNQVNTRTSSSSVGRRESTKRMSTKSPARGVVKPMVSGHTITKPTINLSRVNMQRLQNVNLSIIEEGPSTPEGNLDRSVESRRSRTLPERLPVPVLRNEVDDEERVIVNRRTSRFSGGRISSGRYSKRNSGRLSGSARLSKRSSDYSEQIKSPRVTLQDVSRYLTNNQTVNIRLLSETTNTEDRNNSTIIEDTQTSDNSSSENLNSGTIIPETQNSCETSDSEQEINDTVLSKKHTSTSSNKSKRNGKNSSENRSQMIESHLIDPLEGPSWLLNSSEMETEEATAINNGVSTDEDQEQAESPVSSLCEERSRNETYFRVPELPKSFGKSAASKLNLDDDYASPRARTASSSSNLNATNSYQNNEDDDDDDDNDDVDDDHRVHLGFITQRRGNSSKVSSLRGNINDEDSFDDDDDTLMLNMRRQLKPQQTQQLEQPERLQFDMNELLLLTPLKPLLNMNSRTNNGPVQVEVEAEPTATVQLTQKCTMPTEDTVTFGRMSTIKIQHNGHPDLPSLMTVRSEEPTNNYQNRRISELSTLRLSSRIELPRLTDAGLNNTEDNHEQTQMIHTSINSKQNEVQKRKRMKAAVQAAQLASDVEEETPAQKTKKPRQRKKKTAVKDPSTAKVVLEKLNESHRASSQLESSKADRKNSEESISTARSSLISRVDPSSDSESSTASFSSKQIPTRPRRQKAPKNLQEPNLHKKLRR